MPKKLSVAAGMARRLARNRPRRREPLAGRPARRSLAARVAARGVRGLPAIPAARENERQSEPARRGAAASNAHSPRAGRLQATNVLTKVA
jgi:hypothetical protein